jgi:hypothetical protein
MTEVLMPDTGKFEALHPQKELGEIQEKTRKTLAMVKRLGEKLSHSTNKSDRELAQKLYAIGVSLTEVQTDLGALYSQAVANDLVHPL